MLEKILQKRRSIRAFLPDPVPKETLQAIFELAQKAPSNCNVQPWQAFVASGKHCNSLRDTLLAMASNNITPNPDFGMAPDYAADYRKRQIDCAFTLYDTIGIKREDRPGRFKAMLRNFEFFDAPHVVFLAMPKSFGVLNALDVGIYLQTLMLSMSHFGVSSCAQGALGLYPDKVRELLNIDDDMAILVGVSFGYERTDSPVNTAITNRAPLDEIVTFYD